MIRPNATSSEAWYFTRSVPIFLVVYAVAGLVLLPELSLWLDEVLQLVTIGEGRWSDLAENVASHAGGVPLGYVFTMASLELFGDSQFAARLPSLAFSLLACLGLIPLGARAGVSMGLGPVVLLALNPLQFRYALEARPYSAALAISIWTTVVFLRLLDRPDVGRAAAYALMVAVGLYTQPLTIVVAGAHLGFALWERRQSVVTACSVAAAIASFLPWLAFAWPYWQTELVHEVQAHYGWAELRLVVKEVTGLGYFGSAVLLGLAGYGLAGVDRARRRFWAIYLVAPIAGVLAIDWAAGYFVAIRQMIFVLAPLTIAASLGRQRLSGTRPALGAVLAAAVVVGCLYQNAKWFDRPRDDWQAAAEALSAASPPTVCAMFVDDHYVKVYRFFDPDVDGRLCGADLSRTEEVLVAMSPYDSPPPGRDVLFRLEQAGWAVEETRRFGGPEVARLTRPFADESSFVGPRSERPLRARLRVDDSAYVGRARTRRSGGT